MALYSYACDKCQFAFDIRATLAEKELREASQFKCPKCNSKEITRSIKTCHYVKSAEDSQPPPSPCSAGACPHA